MTSLTPAGMRAARAFLGWRQVDLAEKSGISAISIKNIERGATDPKVSTMRAIEKAFTQAGIDFLEGGGVRLLTN